MAYGRRWVIVTDGGHGGSRDCVAAVRALTFGGYSTAVTVSRGTSRAAISRYSHKRIPVPRADASGYAEAIRWEMSHGDYLAVVPASEASLLALGVSVPHLVDKVSLNEAAGAAGIDVPSSKVFTSGRELVAAARGLDYPVAVKPAVRTFSAYRADSPSDMQRLLATEGSVVVQPWLSDGLHAISGVMWEGRLHSAVHERWLRIWPRPCGLASAAVTTEADEAAEGRLESLLSGYEGVFCAQFSGPHLFDLNLRVHSSHALAVAARVNLLALYCDLLSGNSAPSMRAAPGHFYRWLEGDVRAVAEAVRTRRMSLPAAFTALRPRLRAAHSIESVKDPAPMLARLAWGCGRVRMSQDQRRDSPAPHRI